MPLFWPALSPVVTVGGMLVTSERRLLIPPAVGMLLALLAATALVQPAQAGCNPTAHVHPVARRAPRRYRPGLLGTTRPAPAQNAPGRDTPCHGPNCSRRPPRSPFVPPPAPPGGSESWACLADAPPTPVPGGRHPFTPADDGPPVRRPTSVYHPPRLPSCLS